jgi:aryl-alcohol dehydrogenase-like predicted oxidoreductase
MIKQRTLGRTGLKVSEVCLGTMNFGWKTDEQMSLATLDAYHAAGGNFIQATAHCPGVPIPAASTTFSETVVGQWWRSRGIPRDQLVLATRFNLSPSSSTGLELAKFAFACCMESLRRFQTTYLDLVVFEWNSKLLPIAETLKAYDVLVRSGIVRYVGAANFPVWRIADAMGRAYQGNLSRMEMIQSDYSLMTRARFEPEVMSLCDEQRLGFVARSPLAGGFLLREKRTAAASVSARRDWLTLRFGDHYGEAGLAAVRSVAARHEASSAQVSLAWVLRNPVVTSALIGVNSPAQLNALLPAGDLVLSSTDLRQLDHATAAEVVRVETIPSLKTPVRDTIRNGVGVLA